MKRVQLIAFLLIAQFGNSFELPADTTTRTGKFRHFNVAFNWGEVGMGYALPVNQFEGLQEEADAYLNVRRQGTNYGVFGVTFFYKHSFGLGLTYNYSSFMSGSNSYRDYIVEKHPDYYPPRMNYDSYGYSLNGLLLNVSYRKHFRYFFIEPMFRVGFNVYDASGNGFQLKKQGANEYLRISVSETQSKARNSYQLSMGIAHRFKEIYNMRLKIELGARASVYVAPISSVFTFEEEPYGGPVTSNTYAIDRWNPAFAWSTFINCYF